jgi:hypothetical protein
MSAAGGYIANPDATTGCNFCAFRTADQFLALQFNIEYDHRWRNVGIFCAFIVFNVSHSCVVPFFQVPISLPDRFYFCRYLSIPDQKIRFLQEVEEIGLVLSLNIVRTLNKLLPFIFFRWKTPANPTLFLHMMTESKYIFETFSSSHFCSLRATTACHQLE